MCSIRIRPTSWITFIVLLLAIVPSAVWAQAVTPFQIVGHIEQFRLDATVCPAATPASFTGAKMVVTGVEVIIPCYTVILMPAAYKTPRQIFDEAKGISKVNNESGLALQDREKPLAAFEVALDGNIVCNPGCRYIAGQVHISQQSLNVGAGFIKAIDMATGELRVGADPTAPITNADVRVHLNDPEVTVNGTTSGRYGLSNKQQFPAVLPNTSPNSRFPDDRFQVDQGNPTVHALTGFPMCVPRAPIDPDCPDTNRPTGLTTYVMDNGDLFPPTRFGTDPIKACPTCNASFQAPIKKGDYITYAGTLASYPDPGDPAKSIQYVSAHTVVVDMGIYTKPGVDPAYVTLEESLLGTWGLDVLCSSPTAECQDRIKVEGFTTDPSRVDRVHLYALDVVPGGKPKTRLLLPSAKIQAVFGRFRYITSKNAGVLFAADGTTKGATRELMVHLDGLTPLPPGSDVPESAPPVAHGLTAGTYVAPIGEYIFPEPTGVQGRSQPALNFECLAFLVNGWALPDNDPSKSLPDIQPLDPWPGLPAPATLACR